MPLVKTSVSCKGFWPHVHFWIFTVNNALILKAIDSLNNALAFICFTFRSVCMKIIKNRGVSSYFVVEILYEGIFGHVTFFGFSHMLKLCS